MPQPLQHQVVALFDRRGEAIPRVVIGHRLYEQDQVLAPCGMCSGHDCADDACGILSPAPGPRTLTRERIAAAVEAVFRARRPAPLA